jgi:hypothetical protein
MPTSPFAMETALPLSSASIAAKVSTFFSTRSASLTSNLPRSSGVTFFHEPSKAFLAAATARSTSFSVASATEQMTFSVDGLMVSKVLPSTPWTNSLLMKLSCHVMSANSLKETSKCGVRSEEARLLTYRPVGWS